MSVQIRPERDAAVARGRAFLEQRVTASNRAGDEYFGRYAHAIATCAAAMADRFFTGGTLLVFGSGPHATDAQHNAVEFVHPVLPGCRALPALSLTNDMATVTGMLMGGATADDVYAHQLRALGRSGDIALAFAHAPVHQSIARGLDAGAEQGMLTIALTSGDVAGGERADFVFHADGADRDAAHELHLATYHMLWELVHIVLNHRGIGESA